LREIGIEEGVPSYLINDGQRAEARMGARQEGGGTDRRRQRPGRTGEARDRALGRIEDVEVEQMDGKKEHIEFRLPAELRA